MYKTELEPCRIHYKQINGRLLSIKFAIAGRNLNIINAYIPQSMRSDAERRIVWDELEATYDELSTSDVNIIVGDFNARLHAVKAGEEHNIGPYIFGRGKTYLSELEKKAGETSNRDHMIAMLLEKELVAINTFKTSLESYIPR